MVDIRVCSFDLFPLLFTHGSPVVVCTHTTQRVGIRFDGMPSANVSCDTVFSVHAIALCTVCFSNNPQLPTPTGFPVILTFLSNETSHCLPLFGSWNLFSLLVVCELNFSINVFCLKKCSNTHTLFSLV